MKIGSDGRTYGKAVPAGVRVVRKEGVFVIDGAKRAELIAEDPRSAEIIKPLASGKAIRRWAFDKKNDDWLIVTKIGTDMIRYPAVMAHLAKHEALLRPRADQGNHWWELRKCAYYAEFDPPKLICPKIAQEGRFVPDSRSTYTASGYIIGTEQPLFLSAVLNSRFVTAWYRENSPLLKDDFFEYTDQYMSRIPIPDATPEQRAEIEALVQRVVDLKAADADVSALEAEIDRRVEYLYFGDAANRSYDEARAEAAGRVRALLRSGRETPTLEFKATFAGGLKEARDVDALKEASWTAICAFLNAAGGDLVIGVEDDASVLGLDGDLARAGNLDKLILKVESAFGTKLKPNPIGLVEIDPVEIDGKTVLHIRVKGDPSHIYELDGKVYVRRNAASRPALSATETARWWELRKGGRA